MENTLYTLISGDDETRVIVCAEHARQMPPVDSLTGTVYAEPADDDLDCEFCPVPAAVEGAQ